MAISFISFIFLLPLVIVIITIIIIVIIIIIITIIITALLFFYFYFYIVYFLVFFTLSYRDYASKTLSQFYVRFQAGFNVLREKWFSEEVVSRMKCNIMTDT